MNIEIANVKRGLRNVKNSIQSISVAVSALIAKAYKGAHSLTMDPEAPIGESPLNRIWSFTCEEDTGLVSGQLKNIVRQTELLEMSLKGIESTLQENMRQLEDCQKQLEELENRQ